MKKTGTPLTDKCFFELRNKIMILLSYEQSISETDRRKYILAEPE